MAKTKKLELPTNWKEHMREDQVREAREPFVKVVKQSAHIPLGTKTQYPLYIEARTLFLLRELAKVDDMSVQQLVRDQVETLLERRIYSTKKRGTTTKKKS